MKAQIIPVTPFQQNCSLIWCEETMEGAFIDPGGEIERLKAAAEQHRVKVTKILLTHGHIDHAGGSAVLAREMALPIIGPQQEDQFWIDGLEQQSQAYGFPGVEHFVPSQWLNDGDKIQVGNLELDVLHCPGHTPGHVIFFHPPTKTAWVGDVLFKGSIGRTDFPKGDHQTLINSITQKLWPLGDDVTFVPGHGPLSTFGEERQTNPFVADNRL